MANDQSLTVKDKQELKAAEEQTFPGRFYVPSTDIYENEEALVVVMEIPGVEKKDVEINVEKSQLSVEAKLNPEKYSEFKPVYTEYNVGHFSRAFQLSSKIDTGAISATVDNGVLTLRLPKVPEAKPRKIAVG